MVNSAEMKKMLPLIFRNLLNTRELEKIKSAVVDNGLMKEHAYKVKQTLYWQSRRIGNDEEII